MIAVRVQDTGGSGGIWRRFGLFPKNKKKSS